MEGLIQSEAPALIMPAKSRLLVIGVGNVGIGALRGMHEKYDPDKNPYLGMMAIEPNLPMLNSCFEPSKIKVQGGKTKGYLERWLDHGDRFKKIQLGTDGLGAGGDPEVGRMLAREDRKLAEIQAGFADYDHGVIVAGGGGGSGPAAEVIAEELLRAGKTCYALVTTPRAMEGEEKLTNALALLKRMLELCPTLRIQNEMIPNKKLTFREAFAQINKQSLFWILWLLKAILQDRGNVIDLDGNDWKKATQIGKCTTAGFFSATKGFDGLEEGLLGNPYLEPENLQNALRVIYCAKGNWPVEDCEKVDACVKKRMHNQGRDKGVQFKWCINDDSNDDSGDESTEEEKTLGFVSFAAEGPDEEEKRKVQVNVPVVLSAPAPDAIEEEEPAPVPASRENGKYHEPAPTPAAGGSAPRKVVFRGLVNGRKETSEASAELVTKYGALFTREPSLELYQEAQVVQARLLDETGLLFDVPTKPKTGEWRQSAR